jgi:ferredoxin-NADP reductase/ferredoxin
LVVVRVRFEPIGEEIECGPSESVLDAAFRQGYNLAYGCREGQCSACKCFLVEGEVALKPYSTFALSDSEVSSGYSLMCRAMPEQDLVVELLHYDPDSYRLEHAISDWVAEVEAVDELTPDIVRLVLRAPGFTFTPGQYVDVHVEGDVQVEGARRSFSMANVDGDRVELVIKRYPGGRFSATVGRSLGPGDEVRFTGPYGAFHLRRSSQRPVLMIAGGSGIAPVLSLLRQLSSEGSERCVRFFFAAREPFLVDEVRGLGLADFEFVPVGDRRLPELVEEYVGSLEGDLPDVYMCGPTGLLEECEARLVRRGVDPGQIFQDKFTIAAEADPERAGSALSPRAESERDFTWFAPRKRRATLYEDVTIDTQPSVRRYLTRGWPLSFEDGRGTWDEGSTELRSSDWYAFRDPGEQWERPFYQLETALEHQIEGAVRSASQEGLIRDFSPEWVEFLRRFLQIPAYVEHGLWFALATAGRDCLSDSVATCVCLQAAMKQRSAQSIVLYAMDLEAVYGEFPISAARDEFLRAEPWQPTRRLLERLWAARDWGEVIVAANLCFEPVIGTLLRRELGIRAAALNGDTVTPTLARVASQEWEWAREWTSELVRFLVEDSALGSSNRAVLSEWVGEWQPLCLEAASAICSGVPVRIDAERALGEVRKYCDELLEQVGLKGVPRGSGRRERVERRVRPAASRAEIVRKPRATSGGAAVTEATAAGATPSNGSYDYVGIVMAKSAEGDAVAEILGRRDDVVVYEQPAFWDIRAAERLVIPYEDVSEELGYQIDAYSIQHEMSTHYGRMVATDDALMLFSDPTEAMEHLMS